MHELYVLLPPLTHPRSSRPDTLSLSLVRSGAAPLLVAKLWSMWCCPPCLPRGFSLHSGLKRRAARLSSGGLGSCRPGLLWPLPGHCLAVSLPREREQPESAADGEGCDAAPGFDTLSPEQGAWPRRVSLWPCSNPVFSCLREKVWWDVEWWLVWTTPPSRVASHPPSRCELCAFCPASNFKDALGNSSHCLEQLSSSSQCRTLGCTDSSERSPCADLCWGELGLAGGRGDLLPELLKFVLGPR